MLGRKISNLNDSTTETAAASEALASDTRPRSAYAQASPTPARPVYGAGMRDLTSASRDKASAGRPAMLTTGSISEYPMLACSGFWNSSPAA